MECNDVNTCISEIAEYCKEKEYGKALLVNSESYEDFRRVREILEGDKSKKIIYVSQLAPKDGIPAIDDILTKVTGKGDWVLIGLSQLTMFMGARRLTRLIGQLFELSVSGHVIILLDHCEKYIIDHFRMHPDNQNRTILVKSSFMTTPEICFAGREQITFGYKPLDGFDELLDSLEKLSYGDEAETPKLVVKTRFERNIFPFSIYSISKCDSIYEMLSKQFNEIGFYTSKDYGRDEQWQFLAGKLNELHSLAAVASDAFGGSINLRSYLAEVLAEGNALRTWLLWLCMKVLEINENTYLSFALQKSKNVNNFLRTIYMAILDIPHDDPRFIKYYLERKNLIAAFPYNKVIINEFCSQIGKFQSNGIYYLTDSSDLEKREFFRLLETYDYSEDDILKATKIGFSEIFRYLQDFTFDGLNTESSDGNLFSKFTVYFHLYKLQKVTNRIYPEFLKTVEENAKARPYNKLSPRSVILNRMNRENCTVYFMDALGVEYLAYIRSLCEKYGLLADITIAKCQLPSITSQNKDFENIFRGRIIHKNDKLDNLKHHNQKIDYQFCKEPVHLFDELKEIDKEIRDISDQLDISGDNDKAVIVSDHGASRLAVIKEEEEPRIELEEKGEHSGRCCPAKEDPDIPFATFVNGYAVLANYRRFKGGRKADVEVHGGASLEEVLVPIIVLKKKPVELKIQFINSVVKIKEGKPDPIVIYSSISIEEPTLVVHALKNGEQHDYSYKGKSLEDDKHIKFELTGFVRNADLTADLYDGSACLAKGMKFRIEKGTKEKGIPFFKKSKS